LAGLGSARRGQAELGGARWSLKFTTNFSVFAENVSVYARRC
jgi:hypothetical protein